MKKARTYLTDAIAELRAKPQFYFALSGADVLFIWTQDLVPLAGPLLSSIATTLLTVRLFTRERKIKLAPLVGLALLSFPLNVLWTILAALFKNTSWDEAFSSGWSVPAFFFMCFVMIPWARAVRLIAVDKIGVDAALKNAWRVAARDFGAIVFLCSLMTILLVLAFETAGAGLVIAAPLGFALLKVTATSPAPERASAEPADRPRT